MSSQPKSAPVSPIEDKPLEIAGKRYSSRLIIGTGKYKTYEENARALEAKPVARIRSPHQSVLQQVPLIRFYVCAGIKHHVEALRIA